MFVRLGDNDVAIVADACATKLHRWRFLIVHPRNFSINCIISHSHHHHRQRLRLYQIIHKDFKQQSRDSVNRLMSRQVASDHLDQKQQQLLMHVGNHLFCWQIADKYDQQIHLFSFTFLWLAGYFKLDLKF